MAVAGLLNRFPVAKRLHFRYTGTAIQFHGSFRKLFEGRGLSGNILNLGLRAGDWYQV